MVGGLAVGNPTTKLNFANFNIWNTALLAIMHEAQESQLTRQVMINYALEESNDWKIHFWELPDTIPALVAACGKSTEDI